jgi:hypothetical protein
MSAKRAALLLPQLARGFRSSAAVKEAGKDITHTQIAYGDGHHGLRKGYTYVS